MLSINSTHTHVAFPAIALPALCTHASRQLVRPSHLQPTIVASHHCPILMLPATPAGMHLDCEKIALQLLFSRFLTRPSTTCSHLTTASLLPRPHLLPLSLLDLSRLLCAHWPVHTSVFPLFSIPLASAFVDIDLFPRPRPLTMPPYR